MMQTRTDLVPWQSIETVCNDMEGAGWAVRLIVPYPPLDGFVVVFEGDA